MREFLLGLRLLTGSGRGNRTRFLLMVVGSAIGVCCLAVVLSIPGLIAAQDARKTSREPDCSNGLGTCHARHGLGLALTRVDPYGDEALTRIFVAQDDKAIAPPPGLRALPAPGQVYVSPRLHEALRADPGLAKMLPGREAGIISASGLAHPDELYAYVGVRMDEVERGGRLSSFGRERTAFPTVDSSTLDILRFTLAGVVLLPLAVYLSVCARLSAAARARRLAALRLLGLSRMGLQRVNAAETVVAALLGAVLGLGTYWVVNQIASRIGLPGFDWYPSDASLPVSALLVCLIGCPALAWFVSRFGAKRAANDPLGVRRFAEPKPPSLWGLVLLVPGLGIIAGYCAVGIAGHPPTDTKLSSILVPLAVVLVGAGLVLTLPALSRLLARKVAARTGSLSLGLAMRRNEVEPSGPLRVATGLVVLIFAASLTQGVLVELDQVSKNTAPVQAYRVDLRDLTEGERRAIGEVPGTRGHVLETASWSDDDGAEFELGVEGVIASCAQLRAMAAALEGCEEGQPALLSVPHGVNEAPAPPGTPFQFRFVDDQGHHRVVSVRLPERVVHYQDDAVFPALSGGTLIIPPSLVPTGFRPDEGELLLVSDSEPHVVRSVLQNIAAVDPMLEVETEGVDITALRQLAVIKTLLAVGMVLGLVIGVAAYLVAAADRAVERRAQVTALSLLGARRRTLRAVQVAQVVVPLGVGLGLAVVAGKAAESSYLVTGGGAVFWDGDGVPLLLAAAVGAVVVAALGALPLVGRRIDPELIRRD
ncbi:FtsX-like permease family protein [Streptomyces sp. NPDC006186]|uniref:FtsX-like permease family protein n=1 Tax=Streptomyces sp. NPDC006186 TaxID=3155248 RepID=UPI0033A99536